jgi:hypothetical protein
MAGTAPYDLVPCPQPFTVLVDTLFGLSAGRRVDVHAVWMAELGFYPGR